MALEPSQLDQELTVSEISHGRWLPLTKPSPTASLFDMHLHFMFLHSSFRFPWQINSAASKPVSNKDEMKIYLETAENINLWNCISGHKDFTWKFNVILQLIKIIIGQCNVSSTLVHQRTQHLAIFFFE